MERIMRIILLGIAVTLLAAYIGGIIATAIWGSSNPEETGYPEVVLLVIFAGAVILAIPFGLAIHWIYLLQDA